MCRQPSTATRVPLVREALRRRVASQVDQLHTEPIGALSLDLDATFFALSDPQRRGILERLGRGPATLTQLAGPSGLTLNGIKKHVGILEFAGLVETEKLGRVRECRLGPATKLGEAGEWIEAHRQAWESRLDRFERFVEGAQ
jgi:DNA-binding transcriptional ArsR family regulator